MFTQIQLPEEGSNKYEILQIPLEIQTFIILLFSTTQIQLLVMVIESTRVATKTEN